MRRLALLALLAGLLTAVGAPTPARAAEPLLDPPYLSTDDQVEFTVTVDDRIRWDLQEGYLNGPEPDEPELRSYDVQVARASMFAPRRPAFRELRTGTRRTAHVLRLGQGRVLCVRARQHAYGLTSAWSRPECVVRGRDDSAVRRTGSMRVVREPAYADRRATRLTGGRLSMRGVPRGAQYGIVMTEREAAWPDFWVEGGPRLQGCYGGAADGANWCARPTRRAGRLVVTSNDGNPIGGLVVLPRWLPR